MQQTLKGKIAVVTGSSRGIGKAIALRMAAEGAFTIVHYLRNAEKANQTVQEIQAQGGEAAALKADLCRLDEIKRLFESLDCLLQARYGSNCLDILVNNAGVLTGGQLGDTTEEVFDNLFSVNARAPFFVIKEALSRIKDGGRIVCISSLAGKASLPNYLAYSMSKSAVNALVAGLAAQLRPRGITVNAIAPGPVATETASPPVTRRLVDSQPSSPFTLVRPGQPADVANAVKLLVSQESQWITGQCIEASGGIRMA